MSCSLKSAVISAMVVAYHCDDLISMNSDESALAVGGSEIEWLNWEDLPGLNRTSAAATEHQLAVQILETALDSTAESGYLRDRLPEIATELAAPWAAIMRRTTEWTPLAEFGRRPLAGPLGWFLHQVLDRNAAASTVVTSGANGVNWTLAAAPAQQQAQCRELLVTAVRGELTRTLSTVFELARAVGYGLAVVRRQAACVERVQRLRGTLEIAAQLGGIAATQPLLERAAIEAARLLDCERASIFVWDRAHRELMACPALGVEGGVLRIPDDQGLVGECVQQGRVVRVDDVYLDSRFNREVDLATGYRTRNILCVPLVTGSGQRVGAFEVLNKRSGGFDESDEEILVELGRQAVVALEQAREREQLIRRQRQLTDQFSRDTRIVGESPQISALRASLDRLASTDLPVLVLGESGTGKEVVAQTLHDRGPRRDRPFLAVSCAAIPETLLESELFGHEKGAFTDARESRPGKFELAEGGTLFLDEIGDMSPGGQAKLLRVLEQKVITRVGGTQPIRTDVRIVAATNVNLAAAVRERKFREDLYYRLTVVTVELPPLRDRPEDVLPLAEYFLERYAVGRRLMLATEARARLQSHSWPGNVRELRNLMERVAFLCPTETVGVEDLAFIISPGRDSSIDAAELGLAEATAEFQAGYIRRMIKRVDCNMTEAARLLGLHRSNLYRKMRQLGMEESQTLRDRN